MRNLSKRDLESFYFSLVEWCKEDFALAKGVYVPISGGSDGALLACLLAEAYPQKTHCVHFGTTKSLKASDWFESRFNVVYEKIENTSSFAEEKRWLSLQTKALTSDFWIAGSRNKTENVVGNFSLASSVCRVFPIANVWKSEVMQLGEYLEFPWAIMNSSRKADPTCGRTQEMVDIGIERTDLFYQVQQGSRPESDLSGFTDNEKQALRGWQKKNAFKLLPVRYGPSFN